MCVILVADDKHLTPTMVDLAIAKNKDGNGLAWIERGAVRYRKNISAADAKKMIATLPRPYVFHARIATAGGVQPTLCHPFTLDPKLDGTLTGKTTRGVLFHNGHWGDWEDYAPRKRGKLPWSDTRMIAQIARDWEMSEVSEFVGDFQKLVLLTPDGVERFGKGWSDIGGVQASNTYFLSAARVRETLRASIEFGRYQTRRAS